MIRRPPLLDLIHLPAQDIYLPLLPLLGGIHEPRRDEARENAQEHDPDQHDDDPDDASLGGHWIAIPIPCRSDRTDGPPHGVTWVADVRLWHGLELQHRDTAEDDSNDGDHPGGQDAALRAALQNKRGKSARGSHGPQDAHDATMRLTRPMRSAATTGDAGQDVEEALEPQVRPLVWCAPE